MSDNEQDEILTEFLLPRLLQARDGRSRFREDWAASGKTPDERLLLRAYHEGGWVIIELSDDGKEMDLDATKHKALARDVIANGRGGNGTRTNDSRADGRISG